MGDPTVGHGLQVVAEEGSDGAEDAGEGGLDFNEDQPREDGQLPENDELPDFSGGNANELGNLENGFHSSDDVAGDIINPMEDAEYYQGSFQDDANFAEYRSQGSDDEDNTADREVEVQEIDDLPDDVKLR